MDSSTPDANLADVARRYASRGVPVFPVRARGKRPLTARGFLDATDDPDQVGRWWTRWPEANIGLPTGPASGLLVVDLDGGDAADSFRALQRRHGALPTTLWCRTASGWHCYWTDPPARDVPCSAGRIAAGIDVRGDGGYAIAPPSVHPSGVRYSWHDAAVSPAEPPAWLLRLADPPPPPRPTRTPLRLAGDTDRYAAAALEAEAETVAGATEGTRNHTLNAAAFSLGQLVGARLLDRQTVTDALLDAARACGLPEREARRTIRSGLSSGVDQPREVPA